MNPEHSVEYLLRIKGFRHGAAAYPVDPSHGDCPEYIQGYRDGKSALDNYIEVIKRCGKCEKVEG